MATSRVVVNDVTLLPIHREDSAALFSSYRLLLEQELKKRGRLLIDMTPHLHEEPICPPSFARRTVREGQELQWRQWSAMSEEDQQRFLNQEGAKAPLPPSTGGRVGRNHPLNGSV